MTIRDRLWPHFLCDPEVLWEKQDEERDWLLLEWEYQDERWDATDSEEAT